MISGIAGAHQTAASRDRHCHDYTQIPRSSVHALLISIPVSPLHCFRIPALAIVTALLEFRELSLIDHSYNSAHATSICRCKISNADTQQNLLTNDA